MPKYDILTIGSGTIDVFLITDVIKKISNANSLQSSAFSKGAAACLPFDSKVEVNSRVTAVGGGSTNAAITFTRQNLKTASVFKVGDDNWGETIINSLNKEKVKTFPIIAKKHDTDFSAIIVDKKDGSRSILSDRSSSGLLSSSEVINLNIKANWVYISPGGIPLPQMEKIVSFYKKQGAKIAMNPSRRYLEFGAGKIKKLFNLLDVVIMNKEEAALITNLPYSDKSAVFKKLDEMVEGIAVMTEGAKGVTVSDGSHLWQAGVIKNKPIKDRTGAGDAFGSGFVAGLIQNQESCHKGLCSSEAISDSIRLGSANATSVVESVGAHTGVLSLSQFRRSSRWQLNIKVRNL